MNEIYLKISKYPKYAISNFGNVKNIKTEIILKNRLSSDGFYFVGLKNGDSRDKVVKVDFLVANAFLTNNLDSKIIIHIDNDKKNIMIDNLQFQEGERKLRVITDDEIIYKSFKKKTTMKSTDDKVYEPSDIKKLLTIHFE